MAETIAIATYNLRFGGKAGNRIHWQKVLTELQPALFFVQETLEPKTYFSDESYPHYAQQIHWAAVHKRPRSEEHTSELQSLTNLVCRLLLEKKKTKRQNSYAIKKTITTHLLTTLLTY